MRSRPPSRVTRSIQPLTIAAIVAPLIALLVLLYDTLLLTSGPSSVARVLAAGSALPWMLVVFPVLLVLGFVIGYRTQALVALSVMFVAIAAERFHGGLLPNGAINLRFDEVLNPAISVGLLARQWRAGSLDTLRQTVSRVPGILPLGLFLVANLIPTLFIMSNVSRGVSLYVILLAGCVCYIGVVLLVARVGRVESILTPLLIVGAAEAAFGLAALGLSLALRRPDLFGVQVDPATSAVEPYGTMFEGNFFGQFLAAICLIAGVFLVHTALRRRAWTTFSTIVAIAGCLTAVGTLASLARASWLGFVIGAATVGLVWALRRTVWRDDPARDSAAQGSPGGRRWQPALVAAGAVVAGSAGVAALAAGNSALSQRLSSLLDFTTGSGYGRLRVLNLVIKDWHNPILGMGDGSFNLTLPPLPGHAPDAPWIYSMFLAILHDSGVVGMALFLWFLWVVFAGLIHTIRTSQQSDVRALALGMVGALTSLLVAGQATTGLYLMFLWAFLGLAAAVPLLAYRSAGVDGEDSPLMVAVAPAPPRPVTVRRKQPSEQLVAAAVVGRPSDVPAASRRSERAMPALPPAHVASVLVGLALLVLLMYGRSLGNTFLGDEWALLGAEATGPSSIFSAVGYHFLPVTQAVRYGMFVLFGLNPVPYHVLALFLVWLSAAGVFLLAWRLTRQFPIAALAAVLFVGFGNQYEVPLWNIGTYEQTVGMPLYIGGLLLYMRWTEQQLALRSRIWAYAGFLLCLILSPFAYEQNATLIAACWLYRVLIIERAYGFSGAALVARAREWLVDFGLPAVLFVLYLVVRARVGSGTGASQLPGVQIAVTYGVGYLASFSAVALLRAILPGVALEPLHAWRLGLYAWLLAHQWRGFLPVAAVIGVLLAIAKPLYRFLGLFAIMLVISTVLGIGEVGSRHLFLIAVPTSIAWAGLLVALVNRLKAWMVRSGWQPRFALVSLLPSTLVVLLMMGLGIQYAVVQTQSWVQGGTEMEAIYAQTATIVKAHPQDTALYLLNFPDCRQDSLDDCAPMFVNATSIFWLRQPIQFQSVVAIFTQQDVFSSRPPVTDADLLALSRQPGTIIVQYDPQTGAVTQWTDPAAESPTGSSS